MRQIARNSTAESKDNAAESKSDSKTDSKADSKVQKPKTKLPRPAWALSEGEAEVIFLFFFSNFFFIKIINITNIMNIIYISNNYNLKDC